MTYKQIEKLLRILLSKVTIILPSLMNQVD
jgi:hypothetical protein